MRKRAKDSVLLIHSIEYDRSEQNKSVDDEELISRKSEHLPTTNDLTVHFGQYISTKNDPFVRNIYVYAVNRSIRYVIDFSTAVRKRALQASTSYSIFSRSTGHLRLSA